MISRARPIQPEAAEAPSALPYGRQLIEEDDLAAVVAVLRSDTLAQGPRVAEFERRFAETVDAREAVACSSGTAALHLALAGLDVGPGDVCIVPAMSFLSTATAVRYCGAEVVFADVEPDTGLLTPETLDAAFAAAGSRNVKAVLPVHLGGRLCDVFALETVARAHGAAVVEDACHALGSWSPLNGAAGEGRHGRATAFSFHPVKTIACGEGGMVTTGDAALAERMRRLRNHGVTREAALLTDAELSLDDAAQPNPWGYEQAELGFNYRMTDLEAALGLSQLGKLERFVEGRTALARRYDQLLEPLAPLVRPVALPAGDRTSLHLYQVLVDWEALGVSRAEVMRALAGRGVGTQVHYIPICRQPYFARRYGALRLPAAESFYARVLALPLFPAMSEADVERVALEFAAALGR